MRARRITGALVASCSWVGCSGGPGTSPSVVVRDSAGIEIVESGAPAWSPEEGISVDAEPVLDLVETGEGPDHEFYQVADATRLSNGTIAVAESRSGTIRFYAPTGEPAGAIGGAGEGPGEFARLMGLERMAGDSLFAYDQRTRRVTLYGPDRRMAAMIPLPGQLITGILPTPDGLLGTVGGDEFVDGDPGHVRRPGVVVRLGRGGAILDTVARVAGTESVQLDGGLIDARPLFGKASYVGTMADGHFATGDADRMEIRTFAPDGTLVRISRVPGYDLALGDRLEKERAARLELNSSPASRELLDRLPVPPTRPAYADVLVDAEGLVWVEEHRGWFNGLLGSDPARWEVFGRDGAWLGTVELPPRFDAFEIGSDHVLGRLRDEMGIERPQLLRLRRP